MIFSFDDDIGSQFLGFVGLVMAVSSAVWEKMHQEPTQNVTDLAVWDHHSNITNHSDIINFTTFVVSVVSLVNYSKAINDSKPVSFANHSKNDSKPVSFANHRKNNSKPVSVRSAYKWQPTPLPPLLATKAQWGEPELEQPFYHHVESAYGFKYERMKDSECSVQTNKDTQFLLISNMAHREYTRASPTRAGLSILENNSTNGNMTRQEYTTKSSTLFDRFLQHSLWIVTQCNSERSQKAFANLLQRRWQSIQDCYDKKECSLTLLQEIVVVFAVGAWFTYFVIHSLVDTVGFLWLLKLLSPFVPWIGRVVQAFKIIKPFLSQRTSVDAPSDLDTQTQIILEKLRISKAKRLALVAQSSEGSAKPWSDLARGAQ